MYVKLLAHRAARLACVALAFLAVGAHARASFITSAGPTQMAALNGFEVTYSSTGVPIANAARTFSNGSGVAIGEAFVTDMFDAYGVFGETVPVTVARAVAASALPELATAMLLTGGVVAIGSALDQYEKAANVQYNTGGLQWSAISGQQAETNTLYVSGPTTANQFGTFSAACSDYLAQEQVVVAAYYLKDGYTATLALTSSTSPNCLANETVSGVGNGDFPDGTHSVTLPVGSSTSPGGECYNASTGTVTGPAVAGECSSGTDTAISESQFESDLGAVQPSSPAGLVQQAETMGVPVPAGPVTVTGPATQVVSQQTTTGPTGTQTATKTATYTYSGPNVTETSTTANTGTDSTGAPTPTTTTTSTSPQADGTAPPQNPCTQDPSALGCLQLGDPPSDQIPTQTVGIAYSPQTLGLPVGCPGDLTLFGTYTLSFSQACGVATTFKPFIEALGGMAAVLLCLGAVGMVK